MVPAREPEEVAVAVPEMAAMEVSAPVAVEVQSRPERVFLFHRQLRSKELPLKAVK